MVGFYKPQPPSEDTPAEAAFRARARQLANDLETEAKLVSLSAKTAQSGRPDEVLRLFAVHIKSAASQVRAYIDEDFPGPFSDPFRQDIATLRLGAECLRRERLYDDLDAVDDLTKQLEQLNADWPAWDYEEHMPPDELRKERERWGRA